MIRLVLVDDHASYRESLALALTTFPGFEIVGQADSCREALFVIEKVRPDLAVTDLLLPDSDGLSLTLELRRRRCRIPLMLLTWVRSAVFFEQSLALGIRGYALKDEGLADVATAIRQVAAGGNYVSPALRDQPVPEQSPLRSVSAREREILCLLISGLTTKEIAKRLCLSPKTVDAHRLHINRKLGVNSPAALTRLVAQERLLR